MFLRSEDRSASSVFTWLEQSVRAVCRWLVLMPWRTPRIALRVAGEGTCTVMPCWLRHEARLFSAVSTEAGSVFELAAGAEEELPDALPPEPPQADNVSSTPSAIPPTARGPRCRLLVIKVVPSCP